MWHLFEKPGRMHDQQMRLPLGRGSKGSCSPFPGLSQYSDHTYFSIFQHISTYFNKFYKIQSMLSLEFNARESPEIHPYSFFRRTEIFFSGYFECSKHFVNLENAFWNCKIDGPLQTDKDPSLMMQCHINTELILTNVRYIIIYSITKF